MKPCQSFDNPVLSPKFVAEVPEIINNEVKLMQIDVVSRKNSERFVQLVVNFMQDEEMTIWVKCGSR